MPILMALMRSIRSYSLAASHYIGKTTLSRDHETPDVIVEIDTPTQIVISDTFKFSPINRPSSPHQSTSPSP